MNKEVAKLFAIAFLSGLVSCGANEIANTTWQSAEMEAEPVIITIQGREYTAINNVVTTGYYQFRTPLQGLAAIAFLTGLYSTFKGLDQWGKPGGKSKGETQKPPETAAPPVTLVQEAPVVTNSPIQPRLELLQETFVESKELADVWEDDEESDELVNYVDDILPDEDIYSWANELDGYPSILIYGPQGSGKTSFASWLMHRRKNVMGHTVEICDPHREYGQWNGLTCYGDGMDYKAIDEKLKTFMSLIKSRYQQRAEIPNCRFKPVTLVCDEFTQWAKKCANAAEFFEACLSDIRKIDLHVLFISHARTMSALGGSKGLAETRDSGLLELELTAEVDPVTKKAKPKLAGKLKFPGSDRQDVKIAPWMQGDMDFTDRENQEESEDSGDQIEESEQEEELETEDLIEA